MTEEKIEEFLFQINGTLSKIETRLSGVCEVLAQHEHRITNLESIKLNANGGENWKDQLLMLLAKSIIIGITVIGSLVGSSSLIANVLNQSSSGGQQVETQGQVK